MVQVPILMPISVNVSLYLTLLVRQWTAVFDDYASFYAYMPDISKYYRLKYIRPWVCLVKKFFLWVLDEWYNIGAKTEPTPTL